MSSREKKIWSICRLSLLSRLLLFSRSVVSDSFVTPWTVAHQAPLSSGFPRQEYWSGLPFPFPGDLPDLGIEPVFPALAGRFCTTEPPGTPTSLVVIYPLTGIFYLLTTFTHSNSPPTLVTTNMISFLPSLSKYNTMLVPGVPRSDSIFLYIMKQSPP